MCGGILKFNVSIRDFKALQVKHILLMAWSFRVCLTTSRSHSRAKEPNWLLVSFNVKVTLHWCAINESIIFGQKEDYRLGVDFRHKDSQQVKRDKISILYLFKTETPHQYFCILREHASWGFRIFTHCSHMHILVFTRLVWFVNSQKVNVEKMVFINSVFLHNMTCQTFF